MYSRFTGPNFSRNGSLPLVRRSILQMKTQDLLEIPYSAQHLTVLSNRIVGSCLDHMAGLSSFLSRIAAILLTFLSIPDCPDHPGTLHIPFLLCHSLNHVLFFSFIICVEHSVVRRDFYPLSFRFCVFPGEHGALSFAASRGVPVFRGAVPLSTFSNLSFFSIMASFRTAVVFSTIDRFLLLSGEHEDDRETLCMVLGLPMSQIIHYCTVPSHHLHQKKKECVSLSPAILSFLY